MTHKTAALQAGDGRFWAGLGLITLLGVGLALAWADYSMRWDEPFMANIINQSWTELLADLESDPGNSAPLHYFLLKLWRDVFGESALALRSLSLVFYAGSLLLLGLSGRRLLGWQGGLIAATLLAFSTSMAHFHAAHARHYALLLLLIVAAGWVITRWLPTDDGSPPARHSLYWYALLALIYTLGLMTHQTYLAVIGAYALAALFINRRLFFNLTLAAGLATSVYLLLLGPALLQTLNTPSTEWLAAPTLRDLLEGYSLLWGTAKGGLILLAVAVVLGVHFRQRGLLLGDRRLRFGLVFFLVMSVGIFALSQVIPVFHPARTPLYFLPAACLLVALIVTRWSSTRLLLPLLAVLTLLSLASAYRTATNPEPIPTASSLNDLATRLQCDDTLLGGLAYSEIVYYLRQLELEDCVQVAVFPAQVREHPGWMDTNGLLAAPTGLQAESAALEAQLAQARGRVWYFVPGSFDQHDIVGAFMQSSLDAEWTLLETQDWRGTYFEAVRLYRASDPV